MRYVIAITSGLMLTALTVAPGLAASSTSRHSHRAWQSEPAYWQSRASASYGSYGMSGYPAFMPGAVKTDPDPFIRQQMLRLRDGNAAGG